jgi:tetratricopeptide (TPR) repeat protein
LAINPADYSTENDLGIALTQQDKWTEAAEHYRRAVRLSPSSHAAHFNYAMALARLGDIEGAASQYTECLRLNPGLAEAHLGYGLLLRDQGRADDARIQFNEALRLKPGYAEARGQLELLLALGASGPEAVTHYREAVRLSPDCVPALNNLAWLLATHPDPALRDGPGAVRLARHACDLAKDSQPFLLGTLAAAYAEAGQFADAVATATKARELALAGNQPLVAARNLELLEIYRTGRPFHESAAPAGGGK